MSVIIAMSTCIIAGGYIAAVEPVIEPVVVAPAPFETIAKIAAPFVTIKYLTN